MAVKEVRICDVFGTAKDVERYTLTIAKAGVESEREIVAQLACDLSPRAVERCEKFMRRAMTAPTTKAKEGQDNGTNDV